MSDIARQDAALPRPEDADSWGEFNDRFQRELASRDTRLPPKLLAVGGLFDATIMIIFGSGHWWLWPGLAVTALVFALLAQAALRADRTRARDAELARLREAWLEHLNGGDPTW